VRILTGTAISLGVFSFAPAIVRRVGGDIFRLHSLHALVAQVSAALIVLSGSNSGGPIAASQVISASVVGLGAAQRSKGVRWGVVENLLVAWVVTISGSALLAMIVHDSLFFWFQ
jgi:PiT family inorganic phosphate transporter